MNTYAWPVYVVADCEGKTTRVVAWFASLSNASAFCDSAECRRADEYGKPGWVGKCIEVRP